MCSFDCSLRPFFSTPASSRMHCRRSMVALVSCLSRQTITPECAMISRRAATPAFRSSRAAGALMAAALAPLPPPREPRRAQRERSWQPRSSRTEGMWQRQQQQPQPRQQWQGEPRQQRPQQEWQGEQRQRGGGLPQRTQRGDQQQDWQRPRSGQWQRPQQEWQGEPRQRGGGLPQRTQRGEQQQDRQRTSSEQWQRQQPVPGNPEPGSPASSVPSYTKGRRQQRVPAAAAAAAAAAVPAPAAAAAPAVSVPPRRAGVTDGPWDRADAAAVREALADAAKIERQRVRLGGGEVVLGQTLEQLQALVTEMGQVRGQAGKIDGSKGSALQGLSPREVCGFSLRASSARRAEPGSKGPALL